jgi:hypothetical protein
MVGAESRNGKGNEKWANLLPPPLRYISESIHLFNKEGKQLFHQQNLGITTLTIHLTPIFDGTNKLLNGVGWTFNATDMS